MTDERPERPSAGEQLPGEPIPAPGAEREPPVSPPAAPPTTAEGGPPGGGGPGRPRRRERPGVPILGIVLVLLGLGLLVERLAPGLELGRLWPYGAVALGLLLVVASVRDGGDEGG
jgi:hypothetical protein